MIKVVILFLLAAFGAVSCTNNSATKSTKRIEAKKLEKSYAEYRAKLISNVKYNLTVDITQAEKYSGTQNISFDLKEPSELTVDFFEAKVQSVSVNGKALEKIVYNNFFITIPEASLVQGANVVQVVFDHPYNKTGSGLYRNVDPEDQRPYMYTDFEPYDAQVFMPCFDQPDLKATYTMTVTAPKDWVVVSSTLETNIEKKGELNTWMFPESAKFSTYLFSLHAGPFKVWTNQIVTTAHTIPHRVMARQSLAKYINEKEWFTNAQKGFDFFEAFFDYPYPFKKYDEVIVPDFNSGAMENVAAVTFNERFVSRSEKTRAGRRSQASVQLHELAHMWFGNLVTMKWWNDIWLNESFATYAAFRALEGNSEFKEAGVDFISSAKASAYREDQLVTTHPIGFEVPDTDVVFANFDGITYGKGASVLKQLAFYLGDDKFKAGIQAYFKKHAFQNAELNDFTAALEGASKINLTEWKKVWLTTAQVNTVKVDYKCENNQVKDAMILQTAPKDYPTLRPHKAQIGIFTFEKNKFKVLKTVDIAFTEASTTVNEMNGLPCDKIALVYPNYMDHDYALVELDQKSTETLMTKISSIEDDMLKVGLWSTLWDMVIAQKIPATQVFDIILAHADKETNPDVLGANMGRAGAVAFGYLAKDEKMKAQREQAIQRLSEYTLKNAKAAKTVDLQKLWFGYFVGNADTQRDLDMIAGFLTKTPAWLKFPIDQDRRWDIVQQLSSKAYKNFEALIEAEKKRDQSSRAEKSVLASKASVPKLEVKKEYFQLVTKGPTTEFPLGKIGSVARNLFPGDQEELHREFSQEFFTTLKSLKGQTNEFLSVYVSMSPSFCATESVNQLREFVQNNGDLPPRVLKSLKIDAQMSERCVGIRQKILDSEPKKAI